MSDLISRESLKQRINLNYNSHQYIDAQSIKDIINTEPSVEDKTVEELNKIKAEIEEHNRNYISDDNAGLERAIYNFIEPHIAELKGKINVYDTSCNEKRC